MNEIEKTTNEARRLPYADLEKIAELLNIHVTEAAVIMIRIGWIIEPPTSEQTEEWIRRKNIKRFRMNELENIIDAALERDLKAETEWIEETPDDQDSEELAVTTSADCGLLRTDELESVRELHDTRSV